MAIPNLDLIRLPALELLEQKGTLTKVGDVIDLLAPKFQLTEEEREEMLPSGTQRKWNNRVNWSCFDLYKAGLLDRPKKGHYQINKEGLNLLATGIKTITRKDLAAISRVFAEFLTPDRKKGGASGSPEPVIEDEQTPEEQIGLAMETLERSLRSDLLEQLANINPYRFEQVVIDLLFAMGYGGSREEAARVTQRSNDEGIDGVINEDRLGLDVIYVQAKRWKSVVGRQEIQSFVGALAGQQAGKGVFITTSRFADTAVAYAKAVAQRVILIDGPRLASLMIEHNIGLSTTRTIAIKRIDSDYFEEG